MKRTAVACVIALVSLAIGTYLYQGFHSWIAEKEKQKEQDKFQLLVRAAAALENIKYDEALSIYGDLLASNSNRTPEILRNRAIASLANVKYNIDLTQDASNDVEKIRAQLPNLFEQSSRAIADFMAAAPDDPVAYQLGALRDIRWIAVLANANPIIADAEQADLFEKLKKYVAKFPQNAFLVTQLNNSAEAMSAVDPTALQATVEPLKQAHQANPRNIYLLCLLIQRLVQLKDPDVLNYVEPLAKLLEPFEWKWKMERRPKDLSELRAAAELGKTELDQALTTIIGWVGEAKSTEGSLVDAKSIEVSELAFLDLRDVQAILKDQPRKTVKLDPAETDVTRLDLPDSIGAKFFDWNVDTKPELLAWNQNALKLGAVENRTWKELLSLPIDFPVQGIVIADLFAVDAHRGTPAPRPATTMDPQQQLDAAMRHETIRDLLLFGPSGIRIVLLGPPSNGNPTWSLLQDDIGLGDLKNVEAIAPVDWESDGDLDLAILADGRIHLRQNLGNRKFQNVDAVSLLPEESRRVTGITVVDLDRDVDLDIVVALQDGLGLLENIQHGQFRFRPLFAEGPHPPILGTNSIAVADFNNDHSWDILIGSLQAKGNDKDSLPQIHFTATDFDSPIRLLKQSSLFKQPAKVIPVDWNNDSLVDVLASTPEGIEISLNQGDGQLSSTTLASSPQTEGGLANLSLGDVDADGWLDAVAVLDGKPTLFSPKPNSNRHLTYRIKGISDPNGGGRNNQYAVGSTVELFGPFGYQARVIEDDSVHFGLGTNEAYYLRNIFVNGLTQGIIDPKPNHILEEKQVLIGSCPFLYGWNGSRWEMITDLLWNAPLGLQIAKGKVLPDRRWEYLSLPRDLMKPHRGAIELRITEELWETAYFDHVALLTIDHPAETEWYSNEKVGPESIAKPILWGYRSTIKPTSVKDQKGRDWTAAVEHADGSYAIPFDKQIKQGLIEPTYLELDFGKITSSKPSQLILTGWIYPTDTSLNIAIDQNDNLEPPAPLSLWVVGKSGEFEQVIPFTGFPGGKPKTIVVPLDLLFKTNDHRIRLMHSSQIYWDQIRLGYGEPIGIGSPFDAEDYKAVDIESRKSSLLFSIGQLRLESADLHYRGFSRELPRTRHEPHWYEYSDVSTFPAWPPLRGNFTQFGSVTPLIQTNDDILVVMGSGDEMILRFQLPETDPPEGWVRDYILHSVGWDKDAAMNTLEGQSSLPLPFSRMSQYPPGFDDRDAALIVNRDHERTLTRKQPAKNFWNLSPSQLKTPTATNSQTKSQ